MAYLGTFFLPPFTSSSPYPTSLYWCPVPDDPSLAPQHAHNAVIRVDTRRYPQSNTYVQSKQSHYAQVEEYILASYGVYRWVSYELVNLSDESPVPCLTLEVCDPRDCVNERGGVIGTPEFPDFRWLCKRGSSIYSRVTSQASLNSEFQRLWRSYEREFGAAEWAKEAFDGKPLPACEVGRMVNGAELVKRFKVFFARHFF
jgi:hypothetical protein